MTKKRWKNLYRAWRKMIRVTTTGEALAWIGFYSQEDKRLLQRLCN